jgi:hypothetical protein
LFGHHTARRGKFGCVVAAVATCGPESTTARVATMMSIATTHEAAILGSRVDVWMVLVVMKRIGFASQVLRQRNEPDLLLRQSRGEIGSVVVFRSPLSDGNPAVMGSRDSL